MIQGFPLQSTVFPGEQVTFCISTDAPAFRVDIYRQGRELALVQSSEWFATPNSGILFPDHAADQDWSQDQGPTNGWPGFDISIPYDFRTGVYIAMFVEGDGMGNPRGNTPPLDISTPDSRYGKALFVIRNPAPGLCGRILYKLPLFTYHAYNDVGGWSLYTHQGVEVGFVSMRRPGGGTGGHPWDDWNFDPMDGSSNRQVFAHWDAPFIAWLESNGYAVDYATDLDLHNDPNLLAPYALVLSIGHDEYWTKEMRDQSEAFIRNGGNFAFFSGNTCWWVVEFSGSFLFRRSDNWFQGPMRPENSLTGVSFRNGGEGNGNRAAVGYVVQNQGHWVFAGTGLQDGDAFGVNEELVGYEADGAKFDRNQGPPFVPTFDDGTPPTFEILGVGDMTNKVDGNGNPTFGPNGNGAATMGVYSNNGSVFTAATTDWPRVVALDAEPNTVQITRNVLNTLAGFEQVNVSAIAGTALSSGAPLTSWQTPSGEYIVEHLAGVDSEGNVFVFYWSPRADWQSVNVSAITGRTLLPGAPLTSWQTRDGKYNVEHLAGVDDQGKVVVFFWSPRADWQAVEVSDISGRTIAGGAPLTSWQTRDGQYIVEHLAGVDDQGKVVVFFWSPRADWQPVDVSDISGQTVAGGAPLTSWQTRDAEYSVEHLAGVDGNGNVIVFFWSPRADWEAVNVSAISGQVVAPGESLTSWQVTKSVPQGPILAEKLAGVAEDGSMWMFSWTPVRDWCAVNLSLYVGIFLSGPPTSWQVRNGARLAEHLAATAADGSIEIIYWE